jgi:uncharacterized coiled-coil DUF342 family protein
MEDSHVAVLLEDLRGQFKVFGEALQATREELQVEMRATRDGLRAEMHEMREGLRAEMHEMRDELRADMHGMRAELVQKIDGVAGDVADLKTRMTRVEGCLNGSPLASPPGGRKSRRPR